MKFSDVMTEKKKMKFSDVMLSYCLFYAEPKKEKRTCFASGDCLLERKLIHSLVIATTLEKKNYSVYFLSLSFCIKKHVFSDDR
jgi:hypothetical protein